MYKFIPIPLMSLKCIEVASVVIQGLRLFLRTNKKLPLFLEGVSYFVETRRVYVARQTNGWGPVFLDIRL